MKEIKVTQENIQELQESDKTVLLDFYADWCGPCKALGPVVSEIAEEYPEVLVGKINIDEEMELAQSYRVVSIPTLVVLKQGCPEQRSVGLVGKERILEMLQV